MMQRYHRTGYTGPLAVAEITCSNAILIIRQSEERYLGKMLTGPADIIGQRCLVKPRLGGKLSDGEKHVVRLNMPRIQDEQSFGSVYASSVTPDVPEGFEYAEPDQALLWGLCPDEMYRHDTGGCKIDPTRDLINKAFDIGDLGPTLFIRGAAPGNGSSACLYLLGQGVQRQVGENPYKALTGYLRMLKGGTVFPASTPRVMMMDGEAFASLPVQDMLDPERLGVSHCIQISEAPVFQAIRTG